MTWANSLQLCSKCIQSFYSELPVFFQRAEIDSKNISESSDSFVLFILFYFI